VRLSALVDGVSGKLRLRCVCVLRVPTSTRVVLLALEVDETGTLE